MMNPKNLAILLYIFMGLMIFPQIPRNEYTLPYIIVFFTLYLAGLILLSFGHYIIPSIRKNWRMGSCRVYDKKYVICSTSVAEKVGYSFIKLVPEQPIADMDKERKESFLLTLQGVLSGSTFEGMVAYIMVRDRYGDNIKKRLEQERRKLHTFAFRETMSTRDLSERIRRELELLRQVPTILEGFYIAVVRDYSVDELELIRKLEADTRSLMSRLSGIGLHASQMWGEELWIILKFMLMGSLTQLSFT